jgi:hypothetical protein
MCALALRTPADRAGATRNILLIRRSDCQAPSRHTFVDIASVRACGGRRDGRDNVVNCLDCWGGVGLVVDERFVGGGVGDTLESVGRHRGLALCSFAGCHCASWQVTAVTTMSGLALRFAIDDACWIAVDPSTDSSMKLARWWAVDELARTSSRECGGRLPYGNWVSRRPIPRWAAAAIRRRLDRGRLRTRCGLSQCGSLVVTVSTVKEHQPLRRAREPHPRCSSARRSTSWSAQLLITDATPSRLYAVPAEAEGYTVQSAPGCRDRASGRRMSFGYPLEGSLTVRSRRGVFAASVCLLAVPVALLFQLIVGSGAEIVLHLVLGVGFLLTAFAVFDFEPPRWLPWVGCLSIGALGTTFLLQGISQLLHNDSLTYLAFQILGQQVETWSGDVFLVWCSAAVLLVSHGKVKLFGIAVMALAVGAEIYSYGVRYFGAGAGGVSPLLKLVLLLPFVWLLLESSKKIPLPEQAKKT